jgi:hypothetical protein
MKNSFSILSAGDFKVLTKSKSKDEFESVLSKNTTECNDIEDLLDTCNSAQRSYFLSQLIAINVLDNEDYNSLCQMDFGTRDGLNYKVVVEVGDYRFTQITNVDSNNILTRRYFILDFTKTITIDESIQTDRIIEITMASFCILVSEICSVIQDGRDGLDEKEVNRYLNHMEGVVKSFIKEVLDLHEFRKELYGET